MNTNQFFYISNGNQIGPVPMEELAGKITPDTDVWCDGMPNWAKASTVPELAAIVGFAAPPPPMGTPEFQQAPTDGYASGNSQNYGGNAQNYGNSQNYGGNIQPYGTQQGAPTEKKPDNYLVWAIVATILCCSVFSLPFGIIGIVNASKVESEWNKGNYAEAQKASDNAKKFTIITAIVGLIANIISAFITVSQNLNM